MPTKLDATTWSRVGELFDELAELAPQERERRLAGQEIAEPVRRWLDKLLTAHDTPDPSVLDRAVDDLVESLVDESAVSSTVDLAGETFGPWRAVEEIGRGGMGVVLHGKRADGQFEKNVAIKLMPAGPATAARAARMRSEIRLLASLEHANIAHLLDGGLTDGGAPYLVMEYVDGQAIDKYCDSAQLGLRARVELIMQTARAIAYSHRRLVVHCDIKPGNVLVTKDGQVKLVDFGIASRVREDAEVEASMPLLHCSPGYAAPEQLAGEPPAVEHDVFALGALLFELITGQRIRDAGNTTRVLFGRAPEPHVQPPSALADADSDLDAICLKALAADPAQRYAGAEAFADDLENWLNDRPVVARNGGRLYCAGKWLRRHHWAAAAGGMGIVALVVGTVLALWQAGEARNAAQHAKAEAERASVALADAEVALGRSEAMQEFLIGLFQAAQADRPPDQLPTTQQILETGARAAMDQHSAKPAERFGMLHAISQIHLENNRFADAEPLIAEAVALARRHRVERPQDLALALLQQSVPTTRGSDLSQSRALLIEAEEAIGNSDRHWETLARVRTERAWVERLKGRPEVAIELLEPLYAESQSRDPLNPTTRIVMKDHLASVYNAVGRLEEASGIRTRLLEFSKAAVGDKGKLYVTTLSNSVPLEYNLGRHQLARDRAREAIDLYNQISERSIVHRAAVLGQLAMVNLELGKFDTALTKLNASATEWAEAEGRELEDFELRYYYRGTAMSRLKRWKDAANDLARARELFARLPNPHQGLLTTNDALLANALCRLGDAEQGEAVLMDLERRLEGELPSNRNRKAVLHDARAACHLAAGRALQALSEIQMALAAGNYPGRIIERAARQELKAFVLHSQGQYRRAEKALAGAESVFLDSDLNGHPHHVLLQATRQELFAGQ